MQADSHNELNKLDDKLNLTGRVIRVGEAAVHGGCANIWEARLVPLRRRGSTVGDEGEKVAVKVIREIGSSSSEKSLRLRLIREVRAWSALHHRNVLPLYGFTYGFSPGSRLASLVSPWMPNGTARRYLQRRSISERIRVLTGVADGLCYLHRHDVVHGDLKGENIMIDVNFEPRIADFGLSKLLDESTNTLTATHTGNPFGSVRWTAPELITSPGINYESDVWSFGMTILELFTNLPPYHHLKRDAQVIVAVHREELPPRPGSKYGMDDSLWELCCDCWKSNPQLRPSTRVIAKRLWDLDLKCKLMARKRRRAPSSPDQRHENSQRPEENQKDKEENGGRVRKSPKLSTLAELAEESLPSLGPGASIPIQQSLARRSVTPRTPRIPTSRSASGFHTRTPSMSSISSSSSRSRRSSRGDLANEIDPRRLLMNTGSVRSEGDIFSNLHHYPPPMRRTQTEPTGLDIFLGDQASGNDFGYDSALAVSTPRQHVHSSFGTPPYAWTTPEAYGMLQDAYAPFNGYGTPPAGYSTQSVGFTTPPVGFATPPVGFATPPAGFAVSPGFATPPGVYATHLNAFGTPPTMFVTPPRSHAHLQSEYDMHMDKQQPLLMDSINDLELLQQSQYLGGFDADIIHPDQLTSSYTPYTHTAFLSSLPLPQRTGSLLFDDEFDNGMEEHVQGHISPFLLPPPSNEVDGFGSAYSSYSPSLSYNAIPSPHALGSLFSENFQYEPSHTSPLVLNQALHSSPQHLYQDFSQSQYQVPSSGTVDFASLQRGVITPALSDVSTPDTETHPHSFSTSLLEDTPLISGLGDAFAFESEDEGEEFDGSLALFGGLDVSGDFVANAGGGAGAEGMDPIQTPHGSPRQLQFAAPLARSQLPTPTTDARVETGGR